MEPQSEYVHMTAPIREIFVTIAEHQALILDKDGKVVQPFHAGKFFATQIGQYHAQAKMTTTNIVWNTNYMLDSGGVIRYEIWAKNSAGEVTLWKWFDNLKVAITCDIK